MRAKKIMAALLAMAFSATALTTAMAAAPSAYDGQPYESVGYTSDDPDGVINLAVIADSDVKIVGDSMYIQGSVYSNGDIYVGDGQGNKIDGMFISGTEGSVDLDEGNNLSWTCEGYIHVNDNGTRDGITYYSTKPEYEGAIKDDNTSFECSYEDFEVPEIANKQGTVQMNVYGQDGTAWGGANTLPQTVTEDTYFEKIEMNGTQNNWQNLPAGLVVDTTAGDVTVVINELAGEWGQPATNPSIEVVGDNDAYIYINNVSDLNNLSVNYDTGVWPPVFEGNSEKTHLYISGDSVNFGAGHIAVADMHVNAKDLTISGATVLYGDIYSGADNFVITGGQTEVYGIVCVPNADSRVVDSGTLYGQLHTNTLTQNGAGRILWQADKKPAVAEKEEPTEEPVATEAPTEEPVVTEEPTPEPTEEPTPEPTKVPLPDGEEIVLEGGYAYIFGDEPEVDENGVPYVNMSPERNVSREELCAMVMRMIDQEYDTQDKRYPVTSKISAYEGAWYERGLAYMVSTGAFDDVDEVWLGAVTRGEVAKLITFGLNLDASMAEETGFTDIEESPYKPYIEIMYGYGYMSGMDGDKFAPDQYMTRAQFCSMFNAIIGRTNMSLETADGQVITPETYSIADLPAKFWGTDAMLKATSAYDEDGYVDLTLRHNNIRNVLDNYDSQLDY